MLKIKEWLAETLGDVVVLLIGYFVCLLLLVSSYVVGLWVAPYFRGEAHRETYGLLSALTLIWIYERQIAAERWQRLSTKLDNLRG